MRKSLIPKAYKPSKNLSIETVPPIIWLFVLLTTAFVIICGVILIFLLSLGMADPPRAGTLFWQAESASDWKIGQEADEFVFFSAPVALPSPPFTLEITANNEGSDDSAWGIRLQNSWSIFISREGYLSVSADENLHWAEFPHIRHDGDNKLYLDVHDDGMATIRINDEIAWAGSLDSLSAGSWEIAHYRNPVLLWKMITLYTTSQIP